MAHVLDLPPEVLAEVFSHLTGSYLPTVARVCKAFLAAAKVDILWQRICTKEYDVKFNIAEDISLTYYEVYSRLLHPYGFTLGLWQIDNCPYGGLVHVKFESGVINAVQYNMPKDPHITDPLRAKTLFTITPCPTGAAESHCHKGYNGSHTCVLSKKEEGFSYKCLSVDKHRHPHGKEAEFREWLQQETTNNVEQLQSLHGQELFLMKFVITGQNEVEFGLRRLSLPQPVANVPLQPGLFKGTYGSHGIELVLLEYDLDAHKAVALKVMGDPNVPADQISIKIDIKRPMILNTTQQAKMETLSQIDTPDLPPEMTLDRLPVQPFVLPRDCFDRNQRPPQTCRFRFHSLGQIAGHGFHHPQLIPGQWVVFDEDTFGHIWMELRSFSIFSRVKETFT